MFQLFDDIATTVRRWLAIANHAAAEAERRLDVKDVRPAITTAAPLPVKRVRRVAAK